MARRDRQLAAQQHPKTTGGPARRLVKQLQPPLCSPPWRHLARRALKRPLWECRDPTQQQGAAEGRDQSSHPTRPRASLWASEPQEFTTTTSKSLPGQTCGRLSSLREQHRLPARGLLPLEQRDNNLQLRWGLIRDGSARAASPTQRHTERQENHPENK